MLSYIQTMLQARLTAGQETLEWRNDHIWFKNTSSVRIPQDIVNACSARLSIEDHEIGERGLSVFNPGGRNGQPDTLRLVLGPQKERKIGTTPMRIENQVDLRPEMFSSYQRLNPLRALLHLPPLSSNLKGFGTLCDALKGFLQYDAEKGGIPCPATWSALGVLCPNASDAVAISTFEVMQNLFPDPMHSLFELQFTIYVRCNCNELSAAKSVSMKSMHIDCSSFSGREPEEHILHHIKHMREYGCLHCKHSFELRKAPPILAVYWIPASGKSELIHPALHFSMKSVFDSGCRDDLDYQLVSCCSKAKDSASLWSAHCKSFQDGKWRNIKDSDRIQIYGWGTTCKLWTARTRLLLFYVKTSAIPISAGSPHCFDVGRWVIAEYKRRGLYPAQIVEIIQTANNEPNYKISWDDGDEQDTLKHVHQIRPLLEVVGKTSTYQIGDLVVAKFSHNSFYSPACIENCFTDNSYLVSWEDGSTTYRVHKANGIRRSDNLGRARRAANRNADLACDVESRTKQHDSSEPTKEGLNASGLNEQVSARIPESGNQQGQTDNPSITPSRGSDEDSSDQAKKLAQTSHLARNLGPSDKQESKGANKEARHYQSKSRSSRRPPQDPLRDSSPSAPQDEGAIFVVCASDCFIFNFLFTFLRMLFLAHSYRGPCSSGYYFRSYEKHSYYFLPRG